MEEKKIVSMEGQLHEHFEKMKSTKAEREKLESANGEITKNVSQNYLCHVRVLKMRAYLFLDIILILRCLFHCRGSTISNTVNSRRRKKSSIVPRTNARPTQMNVT